MYSGVSCMLPVSTYQVKYLLYPMAWKCISSTVQIILFCLHVVLFCLTPSIPHSLVKTCYLRNAIIFNTYSLYMLQLNYHLNRLHSYLQLPKFLILNYTLSVNFQLPLYRILYASWQSPAKEQVVSGALFPLPIDVFWNATILLRFANTLRRNIHLLQMDTWEKSNLWTLELSRIGFEYYVNEHSSFLYWKMKMVVCCYMYSTVFLQCLHCICVCHVCRENNTFNHHKNLIVPWSQSWGSWCVAYHRP